MIDAPSQTGRDDNDTVPDPESRHARIHGETMLQMPLDLLFRLARYALHALQELRKALINDIVTDKIKVSTEVV